ncbi:hypothetical protein EB118_03950 [bacterium]|nr:hypothetical protein [Actinomycetota bacterium]NDG29239.1 hypothetical protein [bacterium]
MSEEYIEKVREKHAEHNLQCEKYYETCPLCQIIVVEQKDKYLTALEEEFGIVVKKYWNRWNRRGYQIANNIHGQELASRLALTAYHNWIRPKYYDIIDISDEELYRHPYIQSFLAKKRI